LTTIWIQDQERIAITKIKIKAEMSIHFIKLERSKSYKGKEEGDMGSQEEQSR